MVERLIILKNNSIDSEDGKLSQKTNSQSLNTDEDESLSIDSSRQYSEKIGNTLESDIILSQANERRKHLLTISTPSVDSINDRDGSASDNPITGKAKKKKRQSIASMSDNEYKRQLIKKRPWYTKVDLKKPIIFVIILFLIYIIWIKRDVLIVRLLTSNARVHHTALIIDQRLHEKDDLSQSSSSSSLKDSSSVSSSQDLPNDIKNDDNDNNNNNNNNINNNNNEINPDHISLTDNDEDSPKTPNKGSTSQKINLRTRRNKMSFTKERHKKKHRHLRRQVVDDDNINDDDDDDDDDAVDDDTLEDVIDKTTKIKEPILPSSIRSSKKNHHHHHHQHQHQHQQEHQHQHQHQRQQQRRRSVSSHKENVKNSLTSKSNTILPLHNDIVQQIQKLFKSQGGRRDLSKILKKETDLNQAQINRFIHKNDFTIITLDTFISILNSLDSTLLLVTK
ncbi:unnamed protein product [Rotaria sp. Silwood2]|nr:unnamed protein product [Rotaria sp. Silwood2]